MFHSKDEKYVFKGAKVCIFFYIWNSDWWILAPIKKDHVYKRPPQKISFSKKHLRIFLMEYLGWLEATFE